MGYILILFTKSSDAQTTHKKAYHALRNWEKKIKIAMGGVNWKKKQNCHKWKVSRSAKYSQNSKKIV